MNKTCKQRNIGPVVLGVEQCVSDGSSTYHTGSEDRTSSNDVLLQPDTHHTVPRAIEQTPTTTRRFATVAVLQYLLQI